MKPWWWRDLTVLFEGALGSAEVCALESLSLVGFCGGGRRNGIGGCACGVAGVVV